MNANTNTGNPDNMTDAEWLAECNRMAADMGLKIHTSIESMRKPLNTHAVALPEPIRERGAGGDGNTSYDKPAVRKGNGATPKQLEWIIKIDNKVISTEIEAIRAKAIAGEDVTFAEAKQALDVLFDKATPYKATLVATKPAEAITEGMWTLGDRIIKVQVAKQGSGNLYAKELIDGSFEYVAGLIRKLDGAVKMTLDEAKAYGRLYGVCCVCARDLTDEASIAAGIGPICAGKF